jgi:hypothetical protein
LPKIEAFRRNPRHGEEKAVSGTLTRRILAAVNEIASIDDLRSQTDCAKKLLSAAAAVEGGQRHADDSLRAGVKDMFEFNPYTEQAKSKMNALGISYNARYADAMSVINEALDCLENTQNVSALRGIFNALATENNDIEGANTADNATEAIVGDPDAPVPMRDTLDVIGTKAIEEGGTAENIEEAITENNDLVGAFTADNADDAVVGDPGASPISMRETFDFMGTKAIEEGGTAENAVEPTVRTSFPSV